MKNYSKNLLLTVFLSCSAMLCKAYKAYDFTCDGIYYEINSTSEKTVSVTYQEEMIGQSYYEYECPSNAFLISGYWTEDSYGDDVYYFHYVVSSYSGSVVIPRTVSYNGVTYNVTRIDDYAFVKCSSLSKVTIPSSITSVGDYAFYGCSALSTISLPSSIISLGDHLFEGCTELYTASLPSSTKKIPWSSFKDCTSLEYITIPNNVTDIGSSAFSGCSSLFYINIPSSVTNIGSSAFYGCTKLTSLSIPNSVTSIGSSAFEGCLSMKTINIPSSVTKIYAYAFKGCTGTMTVNSQNAIHWSEEKNIGDEDDYIVTYHYYPLAQSSFKKIILGNTITRIDDVAPNYWYEGYSAFYYCKNLESIVLPNTLTYIGSNAFYGCSSLSSISLPEGLESIGGDMFWGCGALKSITIPSTITYMGDNVLVNSGVKTLTVNCNIGYGYPSYHGWFYKAPVKDVIIGEGVTYISNNAFYESTLQTLDLPVSLIKVGSGALANCSSLSLITSKATTPPSCTISGGIDAFYNVEKSHVSLFVPKSALTAYKATSPWSDFGVIDYIKQSLIDGEAYANDVQKENQTIMYTRNFNNTKWQALYVPFPMRYDDWKDNFEVARINNFHEYDDDDNGTIDRYVLEVVKIKSGSISANTPYLIKAKATGEQIISVDNTILYAAASNSVDCSSTTTKYTFTGTYETIPAATLLANNYYAMGGGQSS